MSEMERNLRDLLELAVGEPPRWVSLPAVRRRAARRRVAQAGLASLAGVLAASLGVSLATGAIRVGPSAASGARQHARPLRYDQAGPPRYYIGDDLASGSGQESFIVVRATATGRVTARIADPRPGALCGESLAAAGTSTFFMTCTIWRFAPSAKSHGHFPRRRGRITFLESFIYRFQVTSAGRVTGYSLVKGSVLKGVDADNLAAAPDGSLMAIQVTKPGPSGHIYTDSVPAGIYVINTMTGARAFWRSGPYRRGAIQFAGASDMSLTGDGGELVLLEARCPGSRYLSDCPVDKQHWQVRAYGPAALGGSLEGGRVILPQSSVRPLIYAYITPDGSALNAVLTACPRRGTCTVRVAKVSVPAGRVLQVLYQARSGPTYSGVGFFSTDPSGEYLLIDVGGKGYTHVNGWIDHGKLIPLVPANGSEVNYETW